MTTLPPTYRHFCDSGDGGHCTFLGTYKWADVEYDMYYHEGGKYPALYVRWSDQPSDQEGMPAERNTIPNYVQGGVREALWQARRQARMQGLLT